MSGLALDSARNVFVADSAHGSIRRIDALSGIITTVAGGRDGGEGTPATNFHPLVVDPVGIALDGPGNLFITDAGNHRVRRIDALSRMITTVAGTGDAGFSGDGDSATAAQLNAPSGVVLDGLGDLFIADTGNDRIRRVDAVTGAITTVAQVAHPVGVALDGLGNLFVSDPHHGRVLRIDAVAAPAPVTCETPTTTTTTLPPVPCDGVTGLAGARCGLDEALALPLCGADPIPPSLDRALRAKLERANTFLGRTLAARGTRQQRLTRKAVHRLDAVRRQAAAARTPQAPESAPLDRVRRHPRGTRRRRGERDFGAVTRLPCEVLRW